MRFRFQLDWQTEPPTKAGRYWVVETNGRMDVVTFADLDHVYACGIAEPVQASNYTHWAWLEYPIHPRKLESCYNAP